MSFRKEDPELERLYAASISETTPLQLELARQQAARRRPRDLVLQLDRDGFVAPLALEQRLVHRLDGLALDAASGYEALQLSPVAPLGACSVVGLTAQDRTLSATRGTEVVSDPTNVLALISAQRLARVPNEAVRLCTVHEVLRAQTFPNRPGYSRHFRMFALTEAGRAAGEDGFEVRALTSQLSVLDRLFDLLERNLSCSFPERRAVIRTTPERAVLATRLSEHLRSALPHVEQTREPLEAPYYDGVRVSFGATSVAGEFIPIGDAGVFDWLTKLCSNHRLRFIASGFGLQLAPSLFGSSSG